MPKFKIMADAYGRLGLYRAICSNVPGASTGWEKVADEADFNEIRLSLAPERTARQ